jgi:D-serine deaminase-like pyridoxal phosphate-dependent protein
MHPGTNQEVYAGRSIKELTTPALVVDLPTLQENIATMQRMVDQYGQSLRPHIKTHKCSAVARMQVEAGAVGVTCATVGEAEAMAAAGIRDILIANQVVTPGKLDRVARLQTISETKFAVDSSLGLAAAESAAQRNDRQFEVLVEVDIGLGRCGVQTPEAAADLARRVLDNPYLRFGGIQAYHGGTNYIHDLAERKRRVAESDQILAQMLAAVRAVCDVPRVSGAGTGNARHHLQDGLLTEIQAGSYVYSDTTYRQFEPAYRQALFVLATVLSRPVEGRLVLDAGRKSIGTEFGSPELAAYPQFNEYHFSEEHLQWQVDGTIPLQVGDKVKIIPSHCCTTSNLHRRCYAVQDERVVEEWAIDAF